MERPAVIALRDKGDHDIDIDNFFQNWFIPEKEDKLVEEPELKGKAPTKDDICTHKYECAVCTDEFTHDKMFAMVYCVHKVCLDCARKHFGNQIKNYSIHNVSCPFPNCTDVTKMNEEERQQYFSLLTCQLKEILDDEYIDLLDVKLRDMSLSGLPGFFWCPRCQNGIIAGEDDVEFVQCVGGCNAYICPNCREEWTINHRGKSCEEFKAWKRNTNVAQQHDRLKTFMEKYGMECPGCNMQFIKSAGGCLHMTCHMCKYEFCEGCLSPFAEGKNCKVGTHCADQGFHAHHPRNCFYFLRDWTPAKLQQLLTRNNINFETETQQKTEVCTVMEQKETATGFVDEECGQPVLPLYAGMCEKHYVQYLGGLILKNKLDPFTEYDTEELEAIFAQTGLPVPKRDNLYHQKLLDGIAAYGITKIAQDTLLCDPRQEVFYSDEEDEEDGLDAEGFGLFPPSRHAAIALGWKTPPEENLFGAVAAAPAPKAVVQPVVEEEGWSCDYCTFRNDVAVFVCCMCNRSRMVAGGGCDEGPYNEGIECLSCTLINAANAEMCDACGTMLTGNVVVLDL